MNMTRNRVTMAASLVFALGMAGAALATDLTATVNLTAASPVLTATPDSVTPVGIVYSWADKNGDGVADDPVNAGLNLGAWNLTRLADALGFTLNLHDGTNPGAITWGGVSGGLISTRKTTYGDKLGGPITITGVTDVACSEINASGNGTGNGANIVIAQSGNLTVGSLLAKPANATSGRILLTGAGASSGTPSGWCQIGATVENSGFAVKDVQVVGYERVTVGAGGIKTYQTSSANLNSVTISNIGSGGVEVTGPIQTYVTQDYGRGDVGISTRGGVKLSSVDTHRGLGGKWVFHDAGTINIAAGGNVEVTGALETYMLGNGASYSRNAGNIRIVSTDGWVKLNSINTTNKVAASYNYYAGSLVVTSRLDLAIAGVIDLNSGRGGSYRGNLTLTTSGRGNVTLNSLNLSKMNIAKFDSGAGWSQVEKALENFAVASTGGTGTPADPYAASQTQLRAPTGQKIYYEYEDGGLNSYLGGDAYLLRNLGNTGSGGILMPRVPGAPEIYNVGAVDVDFSSAKLVGNLTTGDAPVKAICYWGTADGGMVAGAWGHSVTQEVATLGNVTNTLTGLASSQTYFFRHYATNDFGSVWATDTVIFSTVGAPTVDNGNGADNVTQTSALLHGNVLSGDPSPQAWFYWGTTDGGESKEEWDEEPLAAGTPGLGAFSGSLSGLPANQVYWYRCYVTNAIGDGWASSSVTFTTHPPAIVIADIAVPEGALGTTTAAVLTVTLSAASAVDVSVDYATANGSAIAPDDYTATSGTLTIPAGELTGEVSVSVIGDNAVEPNETFYVNLSNPSKATISDGQGVVTISNDDKAIYLRHDGSDENGGTAWSDALASLNSALARSPYDQEITIHAQASGEGQSYGVGARTGVENLTLAFQGGWENVDTAPVQTGFTRVADAASANPGLKLNTMTAHTPKNILVTVHRFAFTNVTRGVEINGSGDSKNIHLTISNVTVYAKNDGVYLAYQHSFGHGPCWLTAENVDIRAGLGGPGHGLYVRGRWDGSSVGATEGRASTVTSANGTGVRFTAVYYGGQYPRAHLTRTAIYGSSGHGVDLDAALPNYQSPGSNRVMAVLGNCTIADNGGDGLHMVGAVAGSYAQAADCIFAGNGGQGINLEGPAGVFTCPEDYNVFFNDGIVLSGVEQTELGAASVAGDPLFYAAKTKPAPWYMLGSKGSPAYHSGSAGQNRGAYLTDGMVAKGTLLIVR